MGRLPQRRLTPPDLRAPITESWQRCASAGLDATDRPSLSVISADRGPGHLGRASAGRLVPTLRELLAEIADEAQHLMVVTDEDGRLLWIEGNPRVRSSAADEMSFVEGALWSEEAAGTNAVGTAIALDHAVQVFAAEHFNEVVQRWTCAAAPIHDPASGRLLGLVDLTGRLGTVHPHTLALALATAKTVETAASCRATRERRRSPGSSPRSHHPVRGTAARTRWSRWPSPAVGAAWVGTPGRRDSRRRRRAHPPG